ncbi:tail-anchored protein insertion receptor WRB-like [Rhopalosiphum maidis]|uniref:tail-anchored protein insertion receptor WRB-like n=1 Tax=Rhopalosiphum maidis TaxID=43146 RepID=UPI000EFE623C|nr:tail-anchored protein insertion receptor WRB-like [Rhopalosiphum maidis]
MNLLVWSIIISFYNMFSIKFIPKFVLWLMNMNKEHKKLVNEISVLKNEQSQISIVKEFAKHTKLQRRINKLNEELKTHIRENSSKNLKIKFMCKVSLYAFSVILNLLFVYYNYHKTVLRELPTNWFIPLSWLVRWPSSQVGTMSFVFWYSITNCVAKVTTNNLL